MKKSRKRKPLRQFPNAEIGLLIRDHRQKLGMSMREFAKEAGCDYTLVFRLEQGSDVRLSAFLKLARTYGFPFKIE